MSYQKINVKKIIALLSVFTLIFTLIACSASENQNKEVVSASEYTDETGGETDAVVGITPRTNFVVYDADDLNDCLSSPGMSRIVLNGDYITLNGNGAKVDGNIITITTGGIYSISGTLDDGQIIVGTGDKKTIKLVLNGVNISCSTSAPINIINAEKTIITLADNTENYITDGSSYIFDNNESDEPNAAIFSKDDLTINGSGSLTVNANYNNGIQSKDDLKIIGGTIRINALNDGIKGRDSIAIRDGDITVNAGGDGMQSNNDGDSTKGFVLIEGGTINVTAGEDGIQAETSLDIRGGDIVISSGGGSINSNNSGSAKGIKAGVDLTITGGTINIDSFDDALSSDDSLTINGGNIKLASRDDGMHSNSTLEINGGDINITKCYEGIEGAIITINGGNIHLVASDDGINATNNDISSSARRTLKKMT